MRLRMGGPPFNALGRLLASLLGGFTDPNIQSEIEDDTLLSQLDALRLLKWSRFPLRAKRVIRNVLTPAGLCGKDLH